jgi:hypothetical protein
VVQEVGECRGGKEHASEVRKALVLLEQSAVLGTQVIVVLYFAGNL